MSPQCKTLLNALKTGRTLTVAEALSIYGVYALSQRMGELRRLGYKINSEFVKIGDKHVARYWLEKSETPASVVRSDYRKTGERWQELFGGDPIEEL